MKNKEIHNPINSTIKTTSTGSVNTSTVKQISLAICMAVAVAGSAFAGTDVKTFKDKVVVEPTCNFRDTEIQVDLFGAGAFSNQARSAFGGGIGANFFFARYFGIGVEQDLMGRSGTPALWSTLGSLYLRYPICSWNLAPYMMVGGGTTYASNLKGHGEGHVGAGLEYRFTPHIGIFTDGRYVYSSVEPKGGALVRTGLRLAF